MLTYNLSGSEFYERVNGSSKLTYILNELLFSNAEKFHVKFKFSSLDYPSNSSSSSFSLADGII